MPKEQEWNVFHPSGQCQMVNNKIMNEQNAQLMSEYVMWLHLLLEQRRR